MHDLDQIGTACCAKADGPVNSNSPTSQCFMMSSPKTLVLFLFEWMLVDRCSRRPSPGAHPASYPLADPRMALRRQA